MRFRRQSITPYKILHLLFSLWYEFFVHNALRVEKNDQRDLDAGRFEFQFLRPRGCLTTLFITLSLCFGVKGKTIGLISRNNFVKKKLSASAIAIMSRQIVTRSFLCSGVKECGTNRAHNLLFPRFSFRIRRTTVLGMFKDIPSFLRDSTVIFDQISNSNNVYLSSSRFWTANSLVFYQFPSVSNSRMPLKNV